MLKRVNVLSLQTGQAFRATEAKANSLVHSEEGYKFIPKKKLKALIKEQKKRNEQDRIRQERIIGERKRKAAMKQAYENMQTLKVGAVQNEINNKHLKDM